VPRKLAASVSCTHNHDAVPANPPLLFAPTWLTCSSPLGRRTATREKRKLIIATSNEKEQKEQGFTYEVTGRKVSTDELLEISAAVSSNFLLSHLNEKQVYPISFRPWPIRVIVLTAVFFVAAFAATRRFQLHGRVHLQGRAASHSCRRAWGMVLRGTIWCV
jgi:hypothetical protein